MPSYHDEETIRLSIDSIYQQHYDDWELIIINDGGKDLKPLINDYLSDKRVTLLNSNENKGQLHALQLALPYIHGQLITLLHSDDLLVPNSFSRLVSYFKNSKIDGIFCDLILINKNQNKIGTLKVINALNRFSPIDILMRTADTGLISDIFFVTYDYFNTQVKNNYIFDKMFYWLPKNFLMSPACVFIPPNLQKVSSWYQYSISEDNYKYSSICKFAITMSRLRISMFLSKKYYIYLNRCQSLFWKGLYACPLLKNIYSYTFHPIFKINDLDYLASDKYYNNLQKLIRFIINSSYLKDKSYFSYLFDWFQNRTNRIWELDVDDIDKFIIQDCSEVGLFKGFQNEKSNIRQMVNFLSSEGIENILVHNLNEYTSVLDFLFIVALPISVKIKD